MVALDDLDARFGSCDSATLLHSEYSQTYDRAKALRERLESANLELYRSIRSEMICGGQAHALLQWIHGSPSQNASGNPSPGPGFDWRDELVSGVLQFREPRAADLQLSPEMVPYQPTPVRHILHLIENCSLSAADVLIDIGSGLGHVPLLVSMLAGIRSLGIEVQPAYVASAQECAQTLHMSSVRFVAEDARAADLSNGNVFYLFSPFTGSILATMLRALRMESTHRPIKICSLGPCTRVLEGQAWLKAIVQPDAGRMSVFRSQ
ncbi:MAG TPA: class I SAM-dependent methyltransferase [Acidobacteriaceae bacterium]|nr:class I SAM-dependent methyltransferase [Acidobacteriaceae bacterium]